MLVLPAAGLNHVQPAQGATGGCGGNRLEDRTATPAIYSGQVPFSDGLVYLGGGQLEEQPQVMSMHEGCCSGTPDDFLVPDPPEHGNLESAMLCEQGTDDNLTFLLSELPCELNTDELCWQPRSDSSAKLSDPGTLKRTEVMPRCISLPNVQLCQAGSMPCSPAAANGAHTPYHNPMQPFQFPRSLSSGCLLSGLSYGHYVSAVQEMQNMDSLLGEQRNRSGFSTSGPPLPAMFPQLNMQKRKGKGGRQPALDPRLDPNVDPKKARRILANRISAAKSKAKQKCEIEILKHKLEALRAQKKDLETEVETVKQSCAAIKEANDTLRGKVQLLQQMPGIHDQLYKKYMLELEAEAQKCFGRNVLVEVGGAEQHFLPSDRAQTAI